MTYPQPGYPQPGYPQPKKRRTRRLVSLVAVLLLAVACTVGGFFLGLGSGNESLGQAPGPTVTVTSGPPSLLVSKTDSVANRDLADFLKVLPRESDFDPQWKVDRVTGDTGPSYSAAMSDVDITDDPSGCGPVLADGDTKMLAKIEAQTQNGPYNGLVHETISKWTGPSQISKYSAYSDRCGTYTERMAHKDGSRTVTTEYAVQKITPPKTAASSAFAMITVGTTTTTYNDGSAPLVVSDRLNVGYVADLRGVAVTVFCTNLPAINVDCDDLFAVLVNNVAAM